MTARRTCSLLLLVSGLALASMGVCHADAGLRDLQGLLSNSWSDDQGDDQASTGSLSSGGSGAGDPWPRRVSEYSVWRRGETYQLDSVSHPRGVVAFAWTAWDGEDGEISLALVDLARGGAATTLRVTNNRFEDSNPRLLTSPDGDLGVAWERKLGPLSLLAFAPLDLENGQLGATRTIAVLGRRVVAAALALTGPDETQVLVARREGPRTLAVLEASPGGRPRELVAIPATAADSLALRATTANTLMLSWSEDAQLEGLIVRDSEGRWGSPAYVRRSEP